MYIIQSSRMRICLTDATRHRPFIDRHVHRLTSLPCLIYTSRHHTRDATSTPSSPHPPSPRPGAAPRARRHRPRHHVRREHAATSHARGANTAPAGRTTNTTRGGTHRVPRRRRRTRRYGKPGREGGRVGSSADRNKPPLAGTRDRHAEEPRLPYCWGDWLVGLTEWLG